MSTLPDGTRVAFFQHHWKIGTIIQSYNGIHGLTYLVRGYGWKPGYQTPIHPENIQVLPNITRHTKVCYTCGRIINNPARCCPVHRGWWCEEHNTCTTMCNGYCVTGADLGMAQYAASVMPHPDCPLHNP